MEKGHCAFPIILTARLLWIYFQVVYKVCYTDMQPLWWQFSFYCWENYSVEFGGFCSIPTSHLENSIISLYAEVQQSTRLQGLSVISHKKNHTSNNQSWKTSSFHAQSINKTLICWATSKDATNQIRWMQ